MPLFVWMVLHSLSAETAVASVPDDSITMQRIDDVVIEARRSPIKVSTAAPVQTLSGTELTRLGIQNMADAVRRFAGANVRDYGGVGGLKTVSVRNMGAAHTGVSYDGAPVSNCQAGQIDIGRFSLDNVSMLSLAIGQNEDLLQPAKLYASAGVLSIVTQRPVFDGDDKSAFQVKIKGGSFGYTLVAEVGRKHRHFARRRLHESRRQLSLQACQRKVCHRGATQQFGDNIMARRRQSVSHICRQQQLAGKGLLLLLQARTARPRDIV